MVDGEAGMDDCDSIRPLLAGYLQGRLAPEEARTIDAHLDSCAGCRSEWADFRAIHDSLGGDVDVQPPPRVLERALSVLERDGGPARPRWSRFGIAAGLAASLLVVVAAIQSWRGRSGSPPDGPPLLPPAPISIAPLPEPSFDFPVPDFEPAVPSVPADGGIAWLKDPGGALVASRETRSPVFCMVDNPDCRVCAGIRKSTLRDPEVVSLSRRFLCLWLDYRNAKGQPGPLPRFGILDDMGRMTALYPGHPGDAACLRAWLETHAPDGVSSVSLEELSRTEDLLREACQAYASGNLGRASARLAEFDARRQEQVLEAHRRQAEALREALRDQVEARCLFVKALLRNGEASRAREFHRLLQEACGGSPLAGEVEALMRRE